MATGAIPELDAEDALFEALDAALDAAPDAPEAAEELTDDACEAALLEALLNWDEAELVMLAMAEVSVAEDADDNLLETAEATDDETDARDEAIEEPALDAEEAASLEALEED